MPAWTQTQNKFLYMADMGLVERIVFEVCDQVKLKLACSATVTSKNIKFLHVQ